MKDGGRGAPLELGAGGVVCADLAQGECAGGGEAEAEEALREGGARGVGVCAGEGDAAGLRGRGRGMKRWVEVGETRVCV